MRIGVIGLGYVGRPLYEAFSLRHDVFGFDLDSRKTKGLRASTEPTILYNCDLVCICVPTDVDEHFKPDFRPLEAAFATAREFSRGMVVNESTVAPGTTRRLAAEYIPNRRFAMSPERINPGDKEHTIYNTVKIIGCEKQDIPLLEEAYSFCPTHFCSIEEAEACKIIENTQRDVNIAFMNEMAMYLHSKNIDARNVFNAMRTKWNALPFSPGMVGGHCIAVDPLYLIDDADQEFSTMPEAARLVNTGLPMKLAVQIHESCDGSIILLGESYKPNVVDTRTSQTHQLKKWLTRWGRSVYVVDPVTGKDETEGQTIYDPYYVLCTGHDCFKGEKVDMNLTQLNVESDWRLG